MQFAVCDSFLIIGVSWGSQASPLAVRPAKGTAQLCVLQEGTCLLHELCL